MGTSAIHRLIEQQASRLGDSVAVVDREHSLTYRDLNQRANARARHLMNCGFRRGSLAVVRMERSLDLAVTLLAVLKAGGAYTWLEGDADPTWPSGLSMVIEDDGPEQRCLAFDFGRDLPAQSAPNLPIVSRGSDAACVFRGLQGQPEVIVPHDTITALQAQPVSPVVMWGDEPGALDLWLTLISGSTAVLSAGSVQSAAA